MPDAAGNLTPAELAGPLQQFLGGTPGFSPLTQAAIAAFQQQSLPIIQQQFQLQGLGRSPALGTAVGGALTQALVPLIQSDLQNRLSAIQLGQQGLGLGQQAARTAADIASQERQGQLQALGLAGQTIFGSADPLARAAQLAQQRQQLALQAFSGAGQAQQDIAQQLSAAQQQDFLRRQALAEAGTFGIFGGSVVPPTLQSDVLSRTKGASSK